MTVLKGGRHAWAPAFCTSCKSIVHYQAEDVRSRRAPEADTIAGAIAHTIMREIFEISCKCGHVIEIGRR